MTQLTLALDLIVAYQIAEDPLQNSTERLFWAVDRFDFDYDKQDVHAKEQRFQARMRIARVLDTHGIPVRDPRGPKAYPGVVPV